MQMYQRPSAPHFVFTQCYDYTSTNPHINYSFHANQFTMSPEYESVSTHSFRLLFQYEMNKEEGRRGSVNLWSSAYR